MTDRPGGGEELRPETSLPNVFMKGWAAGYIAALRALTKATDTESGR